MDAEIETTPDAAPGTPPSGDAGLGRRERKKLQTRRALQGAALRLAVAHGVGEVTVEQIADAADVSSRTFFNYFSSKEEALVGRDPDEIARLRDSLEERLVGQPPLEALRSVLLEMADYLTEHRQEWLARLSLVRSDPPALAAHLAAWAELERALADAVARGTGTDAEQDLYPRLVVGAAVGAMRTAAMRWRDGDGSESLSELVQGAFDSLAAGLPPPGRAEPTRRRARRRHAAP